MSFVATCAVEDRDGTCGAPTQNFLCDKHKDELVMWLWDIGGVQLDDRGQYATSLLDELDTTICRDDKVGGASIGIVTRSGDSSLVFNEKASDAKSSLCNAVVGWTRVFAEENPHLQFNVTTIEAAARWIAAFPNLLAGHSAAVEMHDDIRVHVLAARRCIDRPPLRLYVGVCGGFDEELGKDCEVELFVAAGQREVACKACATVHGVEDRQRDLLLKLRGKVAPAAEVAEALVFFGRKLNVKTLRTWISRGRLTNHSGEGEEPTVQVGDVLKLIQPGDSTGVASCAEAA